MTYKVVDVDKRRAALLLQAENGEHAVIFTPNAKIYALGDVYMITGNDEKYFFSDYANAYWHFKNF